MDKMMIIIIGYCTKENDFCIKFLFGLFFNQSILCLFKAKINISLCEFAEKD